MLVENTGFICIVIKLCYFIIGGINKISLKAKVLKRICYLVMISCTFNILNILIKDKRSTKFRGLEIISI